MTTFYDVLRTAAQKYKSRPALLFEGVSVTYEEILSRAEQLAGGLQNIGVTGKDHLAIIMDNSVECVLAWLGVSLLGSTDVPINPQYRNDLLLYLLEDSGTTVVICDSHYIPQIVEIAEKLPSLRLIVVNGATDATPPPRIQLIAFDECLQMRSRLATVADASERVLLYTSGTTGPSKGVIHTQRSCLALARYNAEMLGYDETDCLLNFFPLYHQNARYTGVIPALCVGARIRLERRFSSSSFWRICGEDGTTAFNYLGSILRMILNVTPPEHVRDSHTVRKAFGAGSSRTIWEEFETRLGIKLVEVYGLTEAPMAAVNRRDVGRLSPIGSAGQASALFEVAIVDDEDHILKAGDVGEIVLRPRRPDVMMMGYHKKDEATVWAYRNLWFHSGDRGRLSQEGDLYFEERGKDSIRRRGENISAWEVESILELHPDVVESAVYGIPSEDTDEDVAAAVILRRSEADLAAILTFAESRLPTYAVPTLVRVMTDLPRTPTAKVQKAELRRSGRDGCLTRLDIMAKQRMMRD